MTAELAADPDRAQVGALVDSFVGLMQTFQKTRARIVAAAQQDVEWSAHLLLRQVASTDAPIRAAELADLLQSDPSTVSRQVAALVKEGFLERRADPDDGRASLLVLTDRARALLAEHGKKRLEYFARVLDGWSAEEIERFSADLERFRTAYETVSTEWLAPKITSRSTPARSKP
jgi:DNA-binding MarR family transcriptional regulator